MARTKAQRSASAKKAAATRKRKATKRSARDVKREARGTAGGVTGLAKAAGNTAENAAKTVAKRVEAFRGGGGEQEGPAEAGLARLEAPVGGKLRRPYRRCYAPFARRPPWRRAESGPRW